MKHYITDNDQLECYIVGGGPSLTNFDWSQLDDKFTIAINRAYEMLPDADIVYFTDNDWYNAHKCNLLSHTGQLIKGSIRKMPNIDPKVTEYSLKKEKGLATVEGQLCHGSNSTYAAINLAGVHLGFKHIYLLGVDLQHNEQQTHWHSGHARIDPESVYQRMLSNFRDVVPDLKKHGIKVYNINQPAFTQLDCFPYSDKLRIDYDGRPMSAAAIARPVQPPAPVNVPPITYRMRQTQPITARQRQEAMAERKRRMAEIKKINQPNRKNR